MSMRYFFVVCVCAVASILLIQFNGQLSMASDISSSDKEYTEKMVRMAYYELMEHRYSEYSKFMKERQEKINKIVEKKGVPAKEAFEQVSGGDDKNKRVKSIKQQFQEHPDLIQRIKEAYEVYQDIIEPAFEKQIVKNPVYRFIPFRESEFDPMKCNSAKVNGNIVTVKGMWQFIESTAKEYNLGITKKPCGKEGPSEEDFKTDERFDVYKSTEAAAAYLRYLIEALGEYGEKPEFVLTAYHMGLNSVLSMIEDVGNNFWEWKPTEENRRKYGFGERSYDYAPYIMAVSEAVYEL